jgi:S-formylglutathione hydrolase FrmB
MGGGGTIIYALHHPEMFATACPLSAAVRKQSEARRRTLPDTTCVQPTKEQLDAYYQRNDPFYLVENMPDNQKTAVRWYFDCGDDDALSEGNSLLHIAMRAKGIPHEFRIRDGAHNCHTGENHFRRYLIIFLRVSTGAGNQNQAEE